MTPEAPKIIWLSHPDKAREYDVLISDPSAHRKHFPVHAFIRADAPELVALVEAVKELKSDMLERARYDMDVIHGEQYRIVNSGAGAWSNFCNALAQYEALQ